MKQTWTLVLITLFLSLWTSVEVREYLQRESFISEVQVFIRHGERFTSEDGKVLTNRVNHLESRLSELESTNEN